jgi:hypothetical protein
MVTGFPPLRESSMPVDTTKHENHPHLNTLQSRERNFFSPPLVGGIEGLIIRNIANRRGGM